jgi:hypothetical protein
MSAQAITSRSMGGNVVSHSRGSRTKNLPGTMRPTRLDGAKPGGIYAGPALSVGAGSRPVPLPL